MTNLFENISNRFLETINYLSNVTIIEQRARIDENKLVEYFVDLDIAFVIDRR